MAGAVTRRRLPTVTPTARELALATQLATTRQTLHYRTKVVGRLSKLLVRQQAHIHRLVAKAADQDATITALHARIRELEENP